MTLEEKGPILPPPRLTKYPQQVSAEVQQWEGIIAATHWNLNHRVKPDGADFYVGEQELGHIHLNGEVHLATGKELAAMLIKNRLGEKFPYGSDWVTAPIDSTTDVAHALWLFRLNFRRLTGVQLGDLKEEIGSYAKLKV